MRQRYFQQCHYNCPRNTSHTCLKVIFSVRLIIANYSNELEEVKDDSILIKLFRSGKVTAFQAI